MQVLYACSPLAGHYFLRFCSSSAHESARSLPSWWPQESLADRGDAVADAVRCRSAEAQPEAKLTRGGIRTASGTEVRMQSPDAAANGVRADAALAAWPVSAVPPHSLLRPSVQPRSSAAVNSWCQPTSASGGVA